MTSARDLYWFLTNLNPQYISYVFYYRPRKLNGYRIKFENDFVIGLIYKTLSIVDLRLGQSTNS